LKDLNNRLSSAERHFETKSLATSLKESMKSELESSRKKS